MSKELKALTIIGNYQVVVDSEKDEISTIKELLPNSCKTLEKSLKALEIIRIKKVNVNCIISGWLLGKYNSYKTHINLTQEEYDLLKEILLGD